MRINSSSSNIATTDFDNKRVASSTVDAANTNTDDTQKVEINKSFEAEMSDSVRNDIKSGSVTPYTEEIKTANSALAHLSKVGGAMKQLSGDKMESAMADLRSITNSLKDILNNNITAINKPTEATYSSDEIKSNLSNAQFASSHDYSYLASKANSLLA